MEARLSLSPGWDALPEFEQRKIVINCACEATKDEVQVWQHLNPPLLTQATIDANPPPELSKPLTNYLKRELLSSVG